MPSNRSAPFRGHLGALIAYIKNPTPQGLAVAIKLAPTKTKTQEGYWGGTRNKTGDLEAKATQLVGQDKKHWGLLLMAIHQDWPEWEQLRKLSPFKGLLVLVRHPQHWEGMGDFNAFIEKIVCTHNDLNLYDGDEYAIELPSLDPADAVVTWLKCNSGDDDGPFPPRDAKGRFKKPR